MMGLSAQKLNLKKLKSLHHFRLSVFIVLCVILGGTSQNVMTYKIVLYLLSIMSITYCLIIRKYEYTPRRLLYFTALGGLFLLLHLAYLIPLPPDIWQAFKGRERIVEGFKIIDAPLPWLPLSLTPEKTLLSLFNFLPAIAVVLIVLRDNNRRELSYTLKAIVIIAFLSVLLGMAQALTGIKSLYLYDITNDGFPVGFFSNVNHQACFLAMALTLGIGLSFFENLTKRRNMEFTPSISLIWILFSIVIFIGVILASSITGYVLLLGISFSILILLRAQTRIFKFAFLPLLAIVCLLIIDFVFLGSHMTQLVKEFTTIQPTSRRVIFSISLELIKEFGFWGGGPGSFADLFLTGEDRSKMTRAFVPHAHNEYVQILLEYGALGAALLFGLLLLLFLSLCKGLLRPAAHQYMATICLIAVTLPFINSLADYPLRNISISSITIFLISYHFKLTAQNRHKV